MQNVKVSLNLYAKKELSAAKCESPLFTVRRRKIYAL